MGTHQEESGGGGIQCLPLTKLLDRKGCAVL